MGELEVTDLVRSGATCSSWRAAFTAFRRLRLPSPKQPPCLLYSDGDGDPDVAVLCAPSSSSSKSAPPIRVALPGLPLSRRTFVGSAYGWLVTADEMSNLHVVNPLTGAQLALPPLAALHNVDTSTGVGGGLMYRVFWNRDAVRKAYTLAARSCIAAPSSPAPLQLVRPVLHAEPRRFNLHRGPQQGIPVSEQDHASGDDGDL